jgi:ribonuclease HII
MTTRSTVRRPTVRRAPGRPPRLLIESALHDGGWAVLAAVDEVGRGALCGPVTVGVVVVTAEVRRPPRGLRDSKLLAPAARQALVPHIQRWASAHAVAHASATEIDEIGIIAALRLAGQRALRALPVAVDGVLLDGNHDYLTESAIPGPPVRTEIKADLRCASVAAASVLAKTTRDAIMVALAEEHPAYRWQENKGYATPAHRAALRRHGPTRYHRVSWRLDASDTGADWAV